MTLREAVMKVLGTNSLTYREITNVVNERRLYIPRDEMLVPCAQVRSVIRESARFFDIDKSRPVHLVPVHL